MSAKWFNIFFRRHRKYYKYSFTLRNSLRGEMHHCHCLGTSLIPRTAWIRFSYCCVVSFKSWHHFSWMKSDLPFGGQFTVFESLLAKGFCRQRSYGMVCLQNRKKSCTLYFFLWEHSLLIIHLIYFNHKKMVSTCAQNDLS